MSVWCYLYYDIFDMKTIWFRRKTFGWGWYPSTWQGWAVIAVFLLLDFGNVYRLDIKHSSSPITIKEFLIETALLVSVLIWICYRTAEKPKWQWGIKK